MGLFSARIVCGNVYVRNVHSSMDVEVRISRRTNRYEYLCFESITSKGTYNVIIAISRISLNKYYFLHVMYIPINI